MNIRYITLSIIMLFSEAHYLCAMECSQDQRHNTQSSEIKIGKQEVDEDITLVCSDGKKVISKSEFEALKEISVTLKNSADDFQDQAITEYHLPKLLVTDITLLPFLVSLKDSCDENSYINIMQELFEAERLSRLLHVADILEINVFLETNTKALANKLQDSECLAAFAKNPNYYIRSLKLNRNIERILVRQLLLKDPLTIEKLQEIEAILNLKDSFIRLIEYSPDDTKIATVAALDDNIIRIWDRNSGQQISELQGHTETVTSISWDKDSTTLSSCSINATVYKWNTKDGTQILKTSGELWTTTDVGLSEFSPKYYDLIHDLIGNTQLNIEQKLLLISLEKYGIAYIKNHINLIPIFNSLPSLIKDHFDPSHVIASALSTGLIKKWQHIGVGEIRLNDAQQRKQLDLENFQINAIDADPVPAQVAALPAPLASTNTFRWFTPRLKKAILYTGILASGYVLWNYSGMMKEGLKAFV